MIWNGGEKLYSAGRVGRGSIALSSARLNPATATRRDEAWRGEASEEEERACRSPLLMLIQVVEELTL